MKTYLTEQEVRRNRQEVVEYLQQVPREGWSLNDVLTSLHDVLGFSAKELIKTHTFEHPKEYYTECGAIGCILGWTYTYPGYQQWCQSVRVDATEPLHANIFLGLRHDHEIFAYRHRYNVPQEQEVAQRLRHLLCEPVELYVMKTVGP